jgi:serine acetyltransferase
MNPLFLWWLSCQVYKRDLYFLSRFLKTVNFLVFHAILPYQADIERDIELSHYGLGVVIHANVKIGIVSGFTNTLLLQRKHGLAPNTKFLSRMMW